MDHSITWVLFATWAVCCLFYLQKVARIARASKLSIFSPVNKYNNGVRSIVKRLFLKILYVTIAFVMAVFIIYYVKSSS
jgi:hypothetical protein